MSIYSIAEQITGLVEASASFMLFDIFLTDRNNMHKWIHITGIVCLAALINFSNKIFDIGFLNYVATIIITLLISFIYQGTFKMRALSATLSFTLSALAEITVLLCMPVIMNHDINTIVNNTNLRLIGIVLSKVTMIIFVLYIRHRANKELELFDTWYWSLFTTVFFTATINLYIFYTILTSGVDMHIRSLVLISTLCICITMIIILYLYETTLKQHFQMTKQQLEQRQLKDQLRHYKAMILSQEQVKGLRHDMKNHLLSIYAKVKHQEYSQCLGYVEDLLNKADATEKFEIDTGNTVLDAILSSKKEEALNKGIKFSTELRIPQKLPLKDNDICIIFGNALDNAIEACEKIRKNPYIAVSIVYEGEALVCRIENSCINQASEEIITTKQDIKNHGIGRTNIQKSLSCYDTVFHIIHEKNKYILSIVFMDIDY